MLRYGHFPGFAGGWEAWLAEEPGEQFWRRGFLEGYFLEGRTRFCEHSPVCALMKNYAIISLQTAIDLKLSPKSLKLLQCLLMTIM
jgi:hypothetical protein